MRTQRQSSNGFTLTELLAAISIIGILSSIALPNYTQSVCKSKQAEAISELTMLQTASMSYSDEFGVIPTSWEQINTIMPVQTLTGSENNKTKATGNLSSAQTLRSNQYSLSGSSNGTTINFAVEPIKGCVNYNAKACVNTQNGMSDITKGESNSSAIATTCT
ncbi:prepilin-type N-terminal cleavage/methylation domain-containing protein [Synechococcus sp. AH-603-L18]|nr:prepilin-type N-terminal cleavage/methylation domain-containing protein [Synechococcus sp. AH-603-L18]MDB4338214.1 prepilin-type N-terminal cleavage/methylation domain-containing protein [Synechococcus sp. AH-603-L18]